MSTRSGRRRLEHFSTITMRYIQPSNNILLNVLSAGSDLSASQSARMCRQVDGSGERRGYEGRQVVGDI
ncbi:putative dynamin-related protein 4A [Platanthera zijinensis]|uniref:Dynamin-related protein 4A n=1 Tax=Platanthera zijinensis TaxID=2320716 RepID=A0AAP0AZV0_9ASPA